ncbi:unnamed protein product [Cuscuta epithymum]|uniref:non-specific serine/threonine protein kinase n=1 Tax=Cuscuta epithymum TaxID=186058 RepID=A0AAV0CPM8_9ASTE|nr:unnamed protein product [Cuscuta epithymum]
MSMAMAAHARNIALLLLLVLLLLLPLLVSPQNYSSTTDTITLNQPLRDGELLISKDNSYALGFFTPGNSTGRRYVGIWYRKIRERLVVWVANRNIPVNGMSGALFIDVTGNLVIQDTKSNISVWNTSLDFPATSSKVSTSAQLRETGNLVLSHNDQKTAAWQSFDHPTNTLLAHMKFGVDRKRGLNLSFSSWKSPDDPAVGDYTCSLQMMGKPQAFMFKDSTPVWRMGPWNGIRWAAASEMTPTFTPYVFTDNADEVTEGYLIKDPSMYSVLMLNESGTVNRIIWEGDTDGRNMKWIGNWYFPIDDCDSYAHCGAFGICNPVSQLSRFECRCVPGFEPKNAAEWNRSDGRHGCRRPGNGNELCRNGEGFLKLEYVKIPDTRMARVDRDMGLEECEELCLKNCSCSGYAANNISDGGTGCITWYGELIDIKEFIHGGQDLFIRVASSDLGQYGMKSANKHRWKWARVIVIVPIIGALMLVFFCFAMKRMKGWASDIDDCRSQHGFAIYYGGNLISWASKKQHVVAKYSTEAEYRAIAFTSTELIWIQQLLRELQAPLHIPPILLCDNLSATYMVANPVFHQRSKHIKIDYHFVREQVADGSVIVRHVPALDQIADIFTKAVGNSRFTSLRSKLHVDQSP